VIGPSRQSQSDSAPQEIMSSESDKCMTEMNDEQRMRIGMCHAKTVRPTRTAADRDAGCSGLPRAGLRVWISWS